MFLKGIVSLPALAVMLTGLTAVSSMAAEQTPVDPNTRTAMLQKYREQCTDPNVDLRLANIEAAIQSGDATRKHICVKLALESKENTTRNLGLRGAIASIGKISFVPRIPKDIEEAWSKKGKEKEEALRALGSDHDAYVAFFTSIYGGLVFQIEDATIMDNNSLWYSMIDNKEKEKNSGMASISGSSITWNGKITYPYSTFTKTAICSLTAQMTNDGTLAGKLSCGPCGFYEVTSTIY